MIRVVRVRIQFYIWLNEKKTSRWNCIGNRRWISNFGEQLTMVHGSLIYLFKTFKYLRISIIYFLRTWHCRTVTRDKPRRNIKGTNFNVLNKELNIKNNEKRYYKHYWINVSHTCATSIQYCIRLKINNWYVNRFRSGADTK